MIDINQSRKFSRQGEYCQFRYIVTVWYGQGMYFIFAVEVDGYPPMHLQELSGFNQLNEALDAGEKRAKDAIDDMAKVLKPSN